MRRTLSSSLTFLHKIIVPAVWLVLFGFITFASFLPGSGVPHAAGSFSLVMLIVGAALMYRFGLRLKVVSVDDNYLYVSNYAKEIAIPLDEISDVTENKWANNRPVTIRLRSPSEFGDKIVFMPKVKMLLFFGDHPVATELRELIAQRRGATRSGY